MNDVGMEVYTSYETLSRWHRKLAINRHFFYRTPEKKASLPPFFADNPDAMEASKSYGVSKIKYLCVELMLSYVHDELIPKLMNQRNNNNGIGSAFVDGNGDDILHTPAPPVVDTGVQG